MSRRVLKWIVLVLLLVGLVAACTPFFQSFFPNSKSRAELSRIPVSDLQPGEYRFVRTGYPHGVRKLGWGVMLVRRWSGELNVWNVWVGEGSMVVMPDLTWNRPGVLCKDFRPSDNFSVSEVGATIECWDEDLSPGMRQELRWSIDGKALGEYHADMSKVDGYDDGEDFMIGCEADP